MLGSRAYCIGGGSAVSILQMQGSANNGLSRQKADTHERQLRVMTVGCPGPRHLEELNSIF